MDKEFRKQIGRSLQEARKAAGFKSAKAFAEHLNMEVSRYTEYEQGRVGFNYEQAWIMADALQCSLDDLGGREWPKDDLTGTEQKLVGDYRDTHDYFKPEITAYAEDQARRHPKNEADSNPGQEMGIA